MDIVNELHSQLPRIIVSSLLLRVETNSPGIVDSMLMPLNDVKIPS